MNTKRIEFSFDNTYLQPQFSQIESRSDVKISSALGMSFMDIPIISANMSTITNSEFANKLSTKGAASALHRFQSLEELKSEFNVCKRPDLTWISLGVSDNDFVVATDLQKLGANNFIIDVAHGAQQKVVDFYTSLRKKMSSDAYFIIGNFGPVESIRAFERACGTKSKPDAYKIGIGQGATCETRTVAGAHSPTLQYTMDAARDGYTVVADGGIKEPRHINLCLAAGASAVMVGSYFAKCKDVAAKKVDVTLADGVTTTCNEIYGSASKPSYSEQGKSAAHRAPEGNIQYVEITSTLDDLLLNIEGGLRSALTYSNSMNLEEFQNKAKFVLI